MYGSSPARALDQKLRDGKLDKDCTAKVDKATHMRQSADLSGNMITTFHKSPFTANEYVRAAAEKKQYLHELMPHVSRLVLDVEGPVASLEPTQAELKGLVKLRDEVGALFEGVDNSVIVWDASRKEENGKIKRSWHLAFPHIAVMKVGYSHVVGKLRKLSNPVCAMIDPLAKPRPSLRMPLSYKHNGKHQLVYAGHLSAVGTELDSSGDPADMATRSLLALDGEVPPSNIMHSPTHKKTQERYARYMDAVGCVDPVFETQEDNSVSTYCDMKAMGEWLLEYETATDGGHKTELLARVMTSINKWAVYITTAKAVMVLSSVKDSGVSQDEWIRYDASAWVSAIPLTFFNGKKKVAVCDEWMNNFKQRRQSCELVWNPGDSGSSGRTHSTWTGLPEWDVTGRELNELTLEEHEWTEIIETHL